MIDGPDIYRAAKLMMLPVDDDLSVLQDAIAIWAARHIRCFQNQLGLQFSAPNVAAIDVVTVDYFWFRAPWSGNDELD